MLRYGMRNAMRNSLQVRVKAPNQQLRQNLHATTTTCKPSSSLSIDERKAPPGEGPNHRSIMSLDGNSIRPFVQPNSYVAPSASVIGSVTINDKAMVLYGSIIRGDLALIHVGCCSIIGENTTLTAGEVIETSNTQNQGHQLSPSDAVAAGLSIQPELSVGDFCDIGANVKLHSCFLDGDNFVGHGCVIEEGATLKRFAKLLPNSFLSAGQVVEEAEIWAGCPAVKVGSVTADDRISQRQGVIANYGTTREHMYEFLPVGAVYWEKEALQKARLK